VWQCGLQMPMVYGKRSYRPQRAEHVPLSGRRRPGLQGKRGAAGCVPEALPFPAGQCSLHQILYQRDAQAHADTCNRAGNVSTQ
jgi:hypothetical protein